MERKIKGTPPRLPMVFESHRQPLYLVTFNTLLRRPLLACDAVHAAFRDYAIRGFQFHIGTGRYVLMPDHIHVFVRIGQNMTLRRWESGLKQKLGRPSLHWDISQRPFPVQKLKASGNPVSLTTCCVKMKAICKNGITFGAIPSEPSW